MTGPNTRAGLKAAPKKHKNPIVNPIDKGANPALFCPVVGYTCYKYTIYEYKIIHKWLNSFQPFSFLL